MSLTVRVPTVLAGLLALSLFGAACSNGDESASTTTTTAPTSAPPTTTPPDSVSEGPPEEPPEPAWVLQIGTPADDSLAAVSARDEELVATGFTEGELDAPGSGARDTLVAVVSTDGEVLTLDQAGDGSDAESTAVASGGDTTVACGSATGDLGSANAGATDSWCAPVTAEGSLGAVYQQGGTGPDRLAGVAVVPDGTLGYAGGNTLGIFPGAADTSAGLLGGGDALLWRIDPTGAPVWIRQFGTEAEDLGQGVAATPDGDGLIVGYTRGDLDGTNNGGADGFISRYDPDGLPRWSRQFGTDGEDWPKGVTVGGEPARGTETFVAVGGTGGAMAPALGGELTDELDAPRTDGAEPAPSNAGATDAFATAFDSTGDQIWTTQLGSTGADDAVAAVIDGSTVLVAGTTAGALATTGDPAAGGTDGFLAALDRDTGALRWITQFGSPADEQATGLTITEDGLVVVSGHTTGQVGEEAAAGGMDGFLIAFPLPSAGGSVASAL